MWLSLTGPMDERPDVERVLRKIRVQGLVAIAADLSFVIRPRHVQRLHVVAVRTQCVQLL